MSTTDADDEPLDYGVAGASARREHQRRRNNRETQTRARHPRIGGLLLALRDEPRNVQIWARGARGEEIVARELAKHCGPGVLVLHDRQVPRSRANIDHIAVAPSGVWVIDSKRYKGKVAVSSPLFGKAKLTIAGRDQSKLVDGLAKQVALVATATAEISPGIPVRGALCFVDADLPILSRLSFRGYALLYPKQLAKRMAAEGELPEQQRRSLAAALAQRFPAA